ncbi:leucine-rich repeat domain-containing protein [Agathobaculum sp.]|uniref:leucine-rich repeat domain-containing protein n=1 Tax=Agathobaculum sp. TaxID=2048138 RepID=UPI002A7F7045|nr:leucine-rich repeat domain-containing protein [Agathobaculum sp.]MDY3618188.1 leucine-rich repeat domain-containing protein [Agathobaculum sp.]
MRVKRILALVCAFAMLQSVPALAASTEDGMYTYVANETGVTLTQVKNVMDKECVLPDELDGKPVTALGASIFSGVGGYYMESVTIPATVERIDPYFIGFYRKDGGAGLREIRVAEGNEHFQSIDGVLYSADGSELLYYPCYRPGDGFAVPEDVQAIGGYAFYNCAPLGNITLPAGLKTIGESAFYGAGLSAIELPDGLERIGDSALASTGLTELSIPATVEEIGSKVLGNCDNITAITFAGGTVPDGFLYNCDNLQSLTLEEGVTAIGKEAFYGCTDLTQVSIPASVRTVGAKAFYDCWNLRDVTVADGVEAIEEKAFYGCRKMESLSLPDSVRTLGDGALAGSGLTEFTVPAGVTVLPNELFLSCKKLERAEFPDTVQAMGISVFSGCEALRDVRLPEGLAELPAYTFSDCKALTDISLPDSITRIGNSAFHSCSTLAGIELPSNLKDLGTFAFYGCMMLRSIRIPEGVTVLKNSVFNFCWSLQSVELPDGLVTIEPYALEQCKALQSIEFPASLTTLDSRAMIYMPALRQVTFRGDAPVSTDALTHTERLYNPLKSCEARQTITVYYPANADGFGSGSIWDVDYIDLQPLPEEGKPVGPEPIPTAVKLSAVLEHSRQDELILWLTVDVTPKTYVNGDISDPTLAPSGALTATLNGDTLPQPIHFVGGGTPTHATFGYTVSQYPVGTTLSVQVTLADSIGFTGSSSNTLTGKTAWPAWDQQLPFVEGDASAIKPEEQYSFVTDSRGDGVIITAVNGELADRTEIILPQTLDGKTVTGLGDRLFAACSNLAYVTIPQSVTLLGKEMFQNCVYLSSVSLPDSVETLPEGLFAGCAKLALVYLPKELQRIEPRAFADCKRLGSITLPAKLALLDKDAFAGCDVRELTFAGDAPEFTGGTAGSFGANTILKYKAGAKGFDKAPWNAMRTQDQTNTGTSSGGGGGGSAPSGTGAKPTVTITGQMVSDAVQKAEKPGEAVVLQAPAKQDSAAVAVSLPDSLFETVAQRQTPMVTLQTPVADISLDADSLRAVEAAGAKDVVVSVEKSTAAASAVPVYDIQITAGGKEISQFGNGRVTVALPYAPAAQENPSSLVACWLRDDGTEEIVRNCAWADGKLTFATGHLSRYTVVSRPSAFSDVSDAAVSFAAARGILNGVGGGKFEPEATADGAMALAVLARLSGAPVDHSKGWRAGYCAWAAEQELLPEGFSPDAPLTGQTLSALLKAENMAAPAALADTQGKLTRLQLARAIEQTVKENLIQPA